MSNIIDISKRITNELPVIKITDDIVVTVNNRKSVILNMQLLVKEMEKKSKKIKDNPETEKEEAGDNEEGYDELSFMERILSMLIGQKNVDAINDLDLPLPEYKFVYQSVMSAATGQTQEEADERFQK